MSDQNEPLSERELEILRLVATGAPNKEIAQILVISPNTVKVHLRNIFSKIGVSTRTEATLYAIQIGLINPVQGPPEEGLPGSFDEESGPGETSLEVPLAAADRSPEPAGTAGASRYRYWAASLLLLLAVIAVVVVLWNRTRTVQQAPPTAYVPSIAVPTQTAVSRWTARPELPLPRKGMAAVEYENGFLLIGGETPQGIDASTLRYSQDKNQWETLANKPTAVTDIQAVVLGEKVYVPGGRLAGGEVTDVLEVYNPRQDAWEVKAPMPLRTCGYAAVSFEGRLYLFGGSDGQTYRPDVVVYDPASDQWERGDPMPTARAMMGAAAAGGKIYVIGGYDGQQALRVNEAYYPSRAFAGEPAWESLSPLPGGRYAMGAASLAGFVYIMGGKGTGAWTDTLPDLLYETNKDQWGQFDTSPTPIGSFPGLVASGSYLYILGGETSQGLSASHLAYQAIFTVNVPIIRDNSP